MVEGRSFVTLLATLTFGFAFVTLEQKPTERPSAAAREKKRLTNADVVSMVKAKLAESTVVLAVAKGPTNFDTSPAALIELKNLGVSAVFIDAMLRSGDQPTEKSFEGKTDKTSSAANSTAASGWTVTTSVSPTGGTKTLILCCSKVFLV